MTYPVSRGRKEYITQRGWFAPPFTACRFAILATISARMGFDVPTTRQPEGVENIVHELQTAGDNTPGNGSTMRQGQKAVAKVFPDSDFLFGALTEPQFFDALRNGATIGFAIHCRQLPRYLKNFVGYGYDGGHYVSVDAIYDDGMVDLFDPMFRPAGAARTRRVPFEDVSPAIMRDNAGRIIVSMGYEDVAVLRQEQRGLEAHIAQYTEDMAVLARSLQHDTADLAAVNAQLEGRTAS